MKTKIDIKRQVHIIVGILILIFTTLTYFVNIIFLILPTLFAIGLLKSGITGSCPLEKLLQKLPYNK